MTLHAMSDVEGPFRAGRIGGPALGEVGLDRVRADLAGLHAHQAVEDILQQAFVGRRRGDMRIELAGVGRTHADDQRLLLRLRLARRQGSAAKASTATKIFLIGFSPTPPDYGRNRREGAREAAGRQTRAPFVLSRHRIDRSMLPVPVARMPQVRP